MDWIFFYIYTHKEIQFNVEFRLFFNFPMFFRLENTSINRIFINLNPQLTFRLKKKKYSTKSELGKKLKNQRIWKVSVWYYNWVIIAFSLCFFFFFCIFHNTNTPLRAQNIVWLQTNLIYFQLPSVSQLIHLIFPFFLFFLLLNSFFNRVFG